LTEDLLPKSMDLFLLIWNPFEPPKVICGCSSSVMNDFYSLNIDFSPHCLKEGVSYTFASLSEKS